MLASIRFLPWLWVAMAAPAFAQFQITTNSPLPAAMVGAVYNQNLVTTGGTGNLTSCQLISGALPNGITLGVSGTSCTLSGTPTATTGSPFSFQVRALDSATPTPNQTPARTFSLTVLAQLAITTAALPAAVSGAAYNFTPAATGGAPPYSWSATGLSGSGISINPSTGQLSGTATAPATYNVSLTVADSTTPPFTVTRTYTLRVSNLTISSSNLANGTLGNFYNQSLSATGGSPPYTWSLASGSNPLPPGLALSSSGVISGTPTATGVFNFTVRVVDSANDETTRALTITVFSSALTITTASPLPQAVVNTAYNATLTASGGSGSGYNWSVTGGTLPAGLSLSAAGVLSGVPTTGGAFSFTVTVQDSANNSSQRTFNLFVATSALTINTASPLPSGTVGATYSHALQALGGSGSGYVFTITSGVLPAGLALSVNGVVAGTPTAAGTAEFTVQVVDNAGGRATKSFLLTVNAPNLQITTTSLPVALVNASYSATLTATGGQSPYVWSIVTGLLPAGISLDFSTGVISGTPTQLGTFNIRFRVQDSSGLTATADLGLQVVGFSIITSVLPPGNVGQPYSARLQTIGGTPPITFLNVGSSLPQGLTLNGATGEITGTPTIPGTYNLAFQARDAANATTPARALTLSITSNLTIITSSPLPNATLGVSYNQTLTASGGTGPYTWAVTSGALPVGLTLNGGTGRISGVPELPAQTFNFVVQVTDTLNATAERPFSITVSSGLAITTNTLPNPSPGVFYQQTLQATGGSPPYVWSLLPGGGTLPAGISLGSNGQLSGTTTQQGTFNFTVVVTDATGSTATQQYTWQIGSPLTISPASLPDATVGVAYNVLLTATGGSGAGYVWSLSSGALPNGLTLNPTTGLLAGTPSGPATISVFTVRVVDSAGNSATRQFSLRIGATNQLSIVTTSLPNGVVGVPYPTTALQASGGSGAGYTWSVLGALPPGLNLTPSGVLAGTPTVVGTYTFGIQVRDSLNAVATQNFTLTVSLSAALSIEPASLPSGSVGVTYTASVTASGGAGGYVFTLVTGSGALPPGLILSPGGVLSGVPTAAGTFTFTVRVTDSQNNTTQRTYTVVITTGMTITNPEVLPAATLNAPYSLNFTVSGGTAPYGWFIVAGLPPTGLSLNPSTGQLTGTPVLQGVFQFTVRVQDSLSISAQKQFSLTVNASGLTITNPDPLPNAALNQAYNLALTAVGGSTPYSWSIVQGSLPAGLQLNASNGVISGTPTGAGAFTFTVRVQDATGLSAQRQFTIVVTAGTGGTGSGSGTLTINNPATLPAGTVNVPYSVQLTASGGQPPYSWEIRQGSFPEGLGFLTTNATLSGTPTRPGTSIFSIRVRDSLGASFERQFTLTILGGGANPLTITTVSLPNGAVGVFYTQLLQATGGTGEGYRWSSEGTLPPGLGVLEAGRLFGTPTGNGTFNFILRVTDSGGNVATRPISLTIGSAGLSITTQALPAGSLGVLYNATFQATGGSGSLVWSVLAGQLPPGMTLSSATGVLTGIPTVAGSFAFTLQVVDSGGGRATREFVLTINSGLAVTTTALPGGSVGQPYSATLAATGGSGSGYVWSVIAGALPPGLTLSASGVISGTPTTNGISNFTVQVTDSSLQTASRPLSITIGATLTIVTQTLPNGQVGVAYNQMVAAAGAIGSLQWSVVGSLPPGLTLNPATGVLAGTPTQNGSFNFTLRVQDSSAASAQRAFTIVIGDSFTITTPTALPNATEGVSYSQVLSASGGQAPYTWSLLVGVLPPGLSLTPTTGLISGSPTTVGSFSFIVQVTDATQQTATKAFTITIGGRLSILTPAQLPPGSVRTPYRETLTASGGIAPFSWTLLNGALPLGVTLTTGGEITGTPTSAGLFTFTVQVTDGTNTTASRTFTLNVTLALSITTASPLAPATAGSAYVQTIAATGGFAPYTFSLVAGALPTGLTLNAQGILAGTPTAAGAFNFTVQVTDANRGTATANLSLTVRLPNLPSVLITGLGETVEAAQQPRLAVNLGAPFPVPLTGVLTLTFTSDAAVPSDDPAVVFSNGRRTVDFTIPANSTAAQLPAGFAMQTGTVAGTIRLAVTSLRSGEQILTPDPAIAVTARVARSSPVMRQVVARRSGSTLEVQVTGWATSREITQALFRFTPAPGTALQTTELTVALTEAARAWYQSEQSRAFGSQFTLLQQFNVQGDAAAIGAVTVTLTNSQGSSPAVTASLQ
ncbi:MAG: Ig domain-containing protein [Bryobacteraceae bacterium]|nr:Ig domain-containing protein [Bryobacteraceae bacterium]MDW8379401.1 putative Ig domain-containing protein [Bryobacterales bacterium]